jgi:peptidoglycan/xylan/chitin deacetylase (PgdA/CDA1 family)
MKLNEKDFCRSLYMSQNMIREMAAHGMVFGIHTHTHPSLAGLTYPEQKWELVTSHELLRGLSTAGVWSVSYPYGAHDETTLRIVKEMGLVAGLTTNVGVNMNDADPLTLKRLDTNDLPFEA